MWGTCFDLSGLADDAGQPVELIHEGFELVYRQLGAVGAAFRAQAAAADTRAKRVVQTLFLSKKEDFHIQELTCASVCDSAAAEPRRSTSLLL